VDPARLEALLRGVAEGAVSVPSALDALRTFPYDDALEYARLDTHRALRTGQPEVVFCPGKTPGQCAEIAVRLSASGSVVLLTRATSEVAGAVRDANPTAVYHETSRCVTVGPLPEPREGEGYVALVSAGTADGPVAAEAEVTLRAFGVACRPVADVGVAGLHRILAVRPILDDAVCVVVVAGMEGALASVVGGLVACPVVACPTSVGYGASFGGVSALLTMLNSCAAGVAVVNIDNGFGAACLAHRIVRSARRGEESARVD
jgi:pyridinium-3,5-biscarboxylic acid mononucleotide synthase